MLDAPYHLVIAALIVLVVCLVILNIYTSRRKSAEIASQRERRDAAKEAKIQTAQTPAQPQPQNAATADSTTLNSQDLLAEANIYIEYGHNAQAAVVLRWYVDMNPTDTGAIQKLLGVYEAVSDITAFTDLLHTIGMNLDTSVLQSDWWKDQLRLGLKYDPGNLELIALASKSGITAPIPDESANMDAITPEKVLAIVSRSNDVAYNMALLQKSVLMHPFKLSLYAEAMRIASKNQLLDKYVDFLLLLYLTVGYKSYALRERMLSVGRSIGPHLLWDALEKWDGNPEILLSLAKARGLRIPDDVLSKIRENAAKAEPSDG